MSAMRFVHRTLPQRVSFGTGEAAKRVAEEVALLGAERVMLVADHREDRLVEQVAGDLPVVHRQSEVVMHVPTTLAESARTAAAESGADVLVTVGGGSTTGLAKAVALTTGLPIVAVPTTYAGSEATDVWGLTEDRTKTTGSDDRVLPRAVVYDAALTLDMPARLSALSGLNALAHCVDSLWAPRADPIATALALEGARALDAGLRRVHDDPHDVEGREQALYGTYLAAVSFAAAGSGLHHKICHVLGGTFDLPHADTHATVLPYVVAHNAPHAPEADRRLAQALGSSSALEGVESLRARLDAPRSLAELGMPEDGIADAVRRVVAAAPADNPGPSDPEHVEALLRAAWHGTDPRSAS
jgi:alcohol dehydrogenase class IV